MKKLILTLLLMPAMVFATITAEQEFALNRLSGTAQKYQLGTLLHKNVNIVVGKYSFAVQGGDVGDISLLSDLYDTNSTIVIPDNAVVKQVYVDVLTSVAGGYNSSVAVKAQTTADLYPATAVASVSSGIKAGTPVGTAATMIKLTADRTLKASVSNQALTAGVFNAYVEYVLGD